jgi:outer membrane protein OmpA-like peptidoglycan-associated protein
MSLIKFFLFIISFHFISYISYSQSLALGNYKPIYKENGGYRKTNFLNKAKVKREKVLVEAFTLIEQMERVVIESKVEKDNSVDTLMVKLIKESNRRLAEISEQTKNIDISDVDSYDKLLNLLKNLRDLKCSRIDAITKFINKNTNKLYGDISFNTGSADISGNGVNELEQLVNKIENDISEWKNYINNCNERVFENDLYILVVNIGGYADQQGSTSQNMILSEERANAVKVELVRQLNKLISRGVNIIFNKIRVIGYGEQLPPGVQQKGEDDPTRRVCIISSLVGPSAILDIK